MSVSAFLQSRISNKKGKQMKAILIVMLIGCVCAAFMATVDEGLQLPEGQEQKGEVVATNAIGRAAEEVLIPVDEAEAKLNAIFKTPAVGGRPLAPSDEPLSYRYVRARCGFVDKQLGFKKKRNFREFPRLSPVKHFSGLKLNLAERLFESEKSHLAQFPGGEIRWTEDGTNGLSIAESDRRIREAQIKCVKEAMRGREAANEAGTVWILNDDVVFGYGIGLREKAKESLSYVFVTRRVLNGLPGGSYIILEHIPSQTVVDSLFGAFKGDETAIKNIRLLKSKRMITILTE